MKKILLIIAILATSFAYSQTYQYLGNFTSNGTPLYLEADRDEISGETLTLIDNSLPESYPVPDFNPHYITAGYDTNIELSERADVWITFVSEGAGYRNTLGFYTYDVNNPPTTRPDVEDITIIFPNASRLYSGGGLLPGDKVKIGTFEAWTGIGWVLLANAWISSQSRVGWGHWQVFSDPDFNPEADPNLRHHNVLLNDPDNERIILGFEDIRRDYASCDNDFNDAIFYITASPYSAISTVNYADVSTATDVSSGNDGGLESNGDLASLIAKRNFNRKKNGTINNTLATQSKFVKSKNVQYRANGQASLETYLPDTGMWGTENSFISSPTDLIGITNAKEVFSLDMYDGSMRVSAALATATEGKVYDHSKMICDRLNSSSLEDVRTVKVRGHQIISSKIARAQGFTEYTLSFSVKLGDTQNELYSFWNLDQYPDGDYYNFQIWGSSFSQVFSIANNVIDTFTAEKALVSTDVPDVVPNVFVKSGVYKNGELHLDIINKSKAETVDFNANIASSETTGTTFMSQTLSLNGKWNEKVVVTTGSLFDVGVNIQVPGAEQLDALYLADGPWGVDYDDTLAEVANFEVESNPITYDATLFEIERQPMVSGTVTGNVNLFRHILPGDQTLDVTEYDALQFTMDTDLPIELVIMPEGLSDWNNRLRYSIPANNGGTSYNISFNDFVDGNGNPGTVSDIKTIVFSVMGDYSTSQAFNLAVSDVAFGPSEALSVDTFDNVIDNAVVYPNPMLSQATIKFNSDESEDLNVVICNTLGGVVKVIRHSAVAGTNEIQINRQGLSRGLYLCKINGSTKDYKTLKLIVQ